MPIADLANVVPSRQARRCHQRLEALDPGSPDDYRQLAALLVDDWCRRGVATVGIGGGQGAGKSTLGRLVTQAGAEFDVRIAVLSIDDFYLTKEERQRLAADVHPLLATRGPPGTHAVDGLRDTLAALRAPGRVQVPRFDKGMDTRSGHETMHGPFDLVAIEGWCVGAKADESLGEEPINALEREDDADGGWRAYVETALGGSYADLNDDLDSLVFLKVPGLDAVRRWRLQQEDERPPERRLSPAQVDRFVEHYERITRRMLAVLSETADVVVELGDDHRVSGLRFRLADTR